MKEKIRDFKGIHTKKPVCILGNGPSLMDTLPRVPEEMHTIGMNASLSHRESDYWVALDWSTLWKADSLGYKPKYAFMPDDPSYEFAGSKLIQMKTIFGKPIGWSNDLEKCIYSGRATIWYALQIAVYMGFDPIFILGMDLQGPRIESHIHAGEPMDVGAAMHQLELMGYLTALMNTGVVKAKVYNCATESLCSCLRYWVPMANGDWSPAETRDLKWRRMHEREVKWPLLGRLLSKFS